MLGDSYVFRLDLHRFFWRGLSGRYGAEIALRRKFEKYISSQRLPARSHCSIPVVCVVIEGGMHTIRTVLEYVRSLIYYSRLPDSPTLNSSFIIIEMNFRH